MRALVSTDLHSSDRAAEAIGDALSGGDFDVHLCLGDLITFRPLSYVQELLSRPPVTTFTLPGNTDPVEARRWLEERGHDLHFRRVEAAGVIIAGAGGCPPPPFKVAFKVEEEEYAAAVPALLDGVDVLALHGPVRGVLDKTAFGLRVGSEALREAVEAGRPKAVLSGHIHEARGVVLWDWSEGRAVERDKASIEAHVGGRTLFMNPGPAKDGRLGALEVEGDLLRASIMRA